VKITSSIRVSEDYFGVVRLDSEKKTSSIYSDEKYKRATRHAHLE
jgi:hypothetical protein